MKQAVKVQTQLTFKNHSGNTTAFQQQVLVQQEAKALNDSRKCLRSVFGLKEFRGEQQAIVEAVLSGKDVLVIMPTGAGKSLCYQLPAVMSRGVTLVVSPLLALIHDQATYLQGLGVKASALNSSVGKREKLKILADLSLSSPTTKILYVTPELLATADFRHVLMSLEGRGMLARLVVDEAHCISEWGHDFRKDFKKLGMVRTMFPKLPILALTATATEIVRKDIKLTLGLPEPPTLAYFLSSFNRDNLYYEVRFDSSDRNNYEDRYKNFLDFIRGVYKSQRKRLQAEAAKLQGTTPIPEPSFSSASKIVSTSSSSSSSPALSTSSSSILIPATSVASQVDPVCGIIYCGQRQTCEDLASRLVRDGIQAAAFHSGMTPKQRADVQGRWCGQGTNTVAAATKAVNGTSSSLSSAAGKQEQPIDVIVATIAFGMGIDKPNVRFVCHWELPKTIEGYYQESGRAGRDGGISRCILYYSREDRQKVEFLIEVEKERRRLKAKANGGTADNKKSGVDTMHNFQKMVAYCENTATCRHVFLCEYFGEENVQRSRVCKDGSRCDICRTPEKVTKEKADKLSPLMQSFGGGPAQYMGGTKTSIGADGKVKVQGLWDSATVALGRYDSDLVDDDEIQDSSGGSSGSDDEIDEDDPSPEDSNIDEDEDHDSDTERKVKRRKLLFGSSVDSSYYKKKEPTAPPSNAASAKTPEAAIVNKHNLVHPESTKVDIKFRGACYETIERALTNLYQGTHRSLSADYMSKLAMDLDPTLGKPDLDLWQSQFIKELAVEIETTGFEGSLTSNVYKTQLGLRVRDIKTFETHARGALAQRTSDQSKGVDGTTTATTTSPAGPAAPGTKTWTTAVSVWRRIILQEIKADT
ncbi:hypothetical protein EMPS_00324 [Entomortierella parvispora]|uniref:ATP-dependent DNA helicase n=1 Tax=Entomortierella parvispora TaxID=205924 RepID=A0A9P3H1G6_9FUNG|nr:hypothetical protein EMPS_00324 [Entomortierella parvispora]